MNTLLRRAANVVMVLSLLTVATFLFRSAYISTFNDFVVFLFIFGAVWAVLWIIGYMLDGRMPWQIIRKGE